ncbi:unnamed protein product [Colletotrichum noveboracense]|uniref:Zn(2)-C6 fungal-type domain-containing protein n=1 Tax=Colletotrichum noveboracense TaxID=2664923 RepID=A0A9W4S3K2_9PEZI|nr:unnamed protein product [Colletotrichum noveboracense]
MSSSPDSSSSPEAPDRRRCWECLRRRLVCDATRPVCNKCRVAGIVCPGYDDKKPLTWLAPGKVTCRTRRKKSTAVSIKQPTKPKTPRPAKQPKHKHFEVGTDIFNGIECIFHAPLRTDVCDVYDAVQYYNAVFYPHTAAGHRDGIANVFVDAIPINIVRFLPKAIAHNMVSIVFQHKMCVQTQWKPDCPSLKHAQARLHHHRGLAIRALNEDIANEKTQSSDVVLTGVILLLQSEIQSCLSPNWRYHVNGLLAMLACRGGAIGWMREVPMLRGILLSFLITATFANTTSPSHDHVRIASHEGLLMLTDELYPLGLHPNMPCPMALFEEIIRINHVRDGVSNGFMSKDTARPIADNIVKNIEAFDARTWEGFYAQHEHNELIGLMFQSAVAVFCLSALRSILVLQSSSRLRAHSDRLYSFLEEGKKYPVLQKSVQWPLIVAGVEAGARVDKRGLVGELFLEQSKDIGTPLPMHAKGVIRNFWDGDLTNWDACFDKPYAFVS